MVLADWGSCSGCAADIDASSVVDFNDLLVLLADFGPWKIRCFGVSYYNLAGTNPSVLPDFSGLTPIPREKCTKSAWPVPAVRFLWLERRRRRVFTSMIDFPEAGVWTLYRERRWFEVAGGWYSGCRQRRFAWHGRSGRHNRSDRARSAVRVEFFERAAGPV